ncbi:hypothetical protein ACSTKE_00115, partial [Vibrio parahaemolyticus]
GFGAAKDTKLNFTVLPFDSIEMVLADFDGDGRADAAVLGDWIAATFVVARGRPDASFDPPTAFKHPSPWRLAAADF